MLKRNLPVCKVVCINEQKIESLKKSLPSVEVLEDAAQCHKAMGHPIRQAILHILECDECCVCDLAHVLGQPVSTVSQHLRVLKSVGLLRSRQDGKLVFYSLVNPVLSRS